MIDVVGLTHVDARHRGLGERRFELQDPRGGGPGRVFVLARQAEHRRHVRHVRLAHGLGLVVLLEVVIAVGQTEAALEGHADHLRRIREVLHLAEAEEGVHAQRVQVRDFVEERLAAYRWH